MSLLISIVLLVFVLAALFYVLRLLLPTSGLPQPFITAIYVLLLIIAVVFLFGLLGYKPLGL